MASNIIKKTETDAANVGASTAELNDALANLLDVIEMEQERTFLSNTQLFEQLLTVYESKMKSYIVPASVATDYVGLHLGRVYEDNDFEMLIKSFRNNQTLDAFYALKIFEDAKSILKSMPNIRECVLTDTDLTNRDSNSSRLEGIIITGDLHGNFNDLNHLIRKFEIPGKRYKFVFNGDFVDRGSKQIETLLTLLFAFIRRPDRVYLNRGNHEDMSMNIRSQFSPNFMTECKKKYGKYGLAIFYAATEMFRHLPLATVVENQIKHSKYFVVHGGIYDKLDMDFLQMKLVRSDFLTISDIKTEGKDEEHKQRAFEQISALLWSDPIWIDDDGKIQPAGTKKKTGCYFNKKRNAGHLFGSDVTKKFCAENGFDALIRSHEVRDHGWSIDHENCFTIFSASQYCNGSNMGAVYILSAKRNSFEIYKYRTMTGDTSSNEVKKNHMLIKEFKRLIQRHQKELISLFRSLDTSSGDNNSKQGYVSIETWCDVLHEYFDKALSTKHLRALKDLICECDDSLDRAYYKTMFVRRIAGGNADEEDVDESDPQYLNFIETVQNLFDIIDTNHNRKISASEAKEALQLVNSKFGINYSVNEFCTTFIRRLDQNGDNEIDLEEFKKAFIDDDEEDAKTMVSNNNNNNNYASGKADQEKVERIMNKLNKKSNNNNMKRSKSMNAAAHRTATFRAAAANNNIVVAADDQDDDEDYDSDASVESDLAEVVRF